MLQHNDDIQRLLEASIQIIDHMHESGKEKEQVERIHGLLHTQTDLLMNGSVSHEFAHNMAALNDLVEQSMPAQEDDRVDLLSLIKIKANLAKIDSYIQ